MCIKDPWRRQILLFLQHLLRRRPRCRLDVLFSRTRLLLRQLLRTLPLRLVRLGRFLFEDWHLQSPSPILGLWRPSLLPVPRFQACGRMISVLKVLHGEPTMHRLLDDLGGVLLLSLLLLLLTKPLLVLQSHLSVSLLTQQPCCHRLCLSMMPVLTRSTRKPWYSLRIPAYLPSMVSFYPGHPLRLC